MVGYQEYVALSQSVDSEERGMAAHLAALAFLGHSGPADEQAALYAALVSFLDDPSVKVRAALAYGLLHAAAAPRPVMVSLLNDAPVIARAVAQYSPALVDADLIAFAQRCEASLLPAIALRPVLGARLAAILLARGTVDIALMLLRRQEVEIGEDRLAALVEEAAGNAVLRGALLARRSLPEALRLHLVEQALDALRQARIVRGALAGPRLERLFADRLDDAAASIGEAAAEAAKERYVARLAEGARITPRTLINALIDGHALFFAECLAQVGGLGRHKVLTLLDAGSRAALQAMLARCGLGPALCHAVARLVEHARQVDLCGDAAGRHYVVSALIEELVIEHDGQIPAELEDVFNYLSEQNITLARAAARGVMAGFAGLAGERPMLAAPERLVLPAA